MATVKRSKRLMKLDKKNENLSGTGKVTRKSRSGMSRASRSDLSSVPLLDMLAEVASATLQNDPAFHARKRAAAAAAKKAKLLEARSKMALTASEKLMLQAELLNLDQIRVLSDKMLLQMFAEMKSDEIRRQYSYKCYLVPDKCSAMFKSFGNEAKARLQMKSHLLTHIAELLAEANVSTRSHKVKFMAEPLQARMKRLQESLLKGKRKSSIALTPPSTISTPKRAATNKSRDRKDEAGKTKASKSKKSATDEKTTKNDKKETTKESEKFKNVNTEYILPFIIKSEPTDEEESEPESEESESEDDENLTDDDVEEGEPEIFEEIEVDENVDNMTTTNIIIAGAALEDGGEREDDSIRHVIDTLEQPGHDHKYTSVLGKKRGIETVHFEYCVSSDEEEANPKKDAEPPNKTRGIMYENPQLIVATPSFPFVYVPLLPNIAQITEVKENKPTSNQKRSSVNDSSGMLRVLDSSSEKPVQKKKQTRVRKMHKIIVPEEMEPISDEAPEDPNIVAMRLYQNKMEELEKQRALATIDQIDEDPQGMYATNEDGTIIHLNGYQEVVEASISAETITPDISSLPPPLTKFMPPDGVEESERKLALKYIRLLRTRRKEERGALVCKICQNRTFTAQATLMYHYRSHAGIKPFICSICGATFTRQHSLNYHMLIHNNKSRFVCEDCGRNFRHPSHYKEHLRRHTGETPYECTDCGLRFKTRNTYKRHLKTRHGKILTAQGIVTLSLEEFYKVRTNPRRKSGANSPSKQMPIIFNNTSTMKKDQETQWPESMTTCLEPEVHFQEIEIRQYLESPPEAVAFQVINELSND